MISVMLHFHMLQKSYFQKTNRMRIYMTVEIIKHEFEDYFARRASRLGARLDDVIFLISPENAPNVDEEDVKALHLLRAILSGEIDADRVDYLTRDSLHTGVIYGKFDYMRLIETLTIVPYTDISTSDDESLDRKKETHSEFSMSSLRTIEPRIGIESGGLHTVEGLILARYFMFLQVYFHPVRRIYDLMLIDFLKEVLPDGKYPDDVEEYLKFDDVEVIGLIKSQKQLKETKEAGIIARRLLERDHPRLVFEEKGIVLKFDEFEKEIKEKISERFNRLDPELDIYVDSARKSSFKPNEAEIFIVKDEIAGEIVEKWDYDRTVTEIRNRRIQHISKRSELLRSLPNIEILRVYAKLPKSEIQEAEQVCRKIYEEFQSG